MFCIQSLKLSNFTVFGDVELNFSPGLNVIVGENGTGKTHLLKIMYATFYAMFRSRDTTKQPSKSQLQQRIAEKLVTVFRPDSLGRLVQRRQGRQRADVQIVAGDLDNFEGADFNFRFKFSGNSHNEVTISDEILFRAVPDGFSSDSLIYLPTRELLSLYPNFVAFYDGHVLDYDETWRDTCVQLAAPARRGPREQDVNQLLVGLEDAMDGRIILDSNGRFYLRNSAGTLEMHLVAEGIRKIAMIARLISTGVLPRQSFLFWDEPEANLNPRLVKVIARTIFNLSQSGTQVFVATHSLFLLRELEIVKQEEKISGDEIRYFGLNFGEEGVEIEQGSNIDEIGNIAALDENLDQSDRYMALK